MGAAPLKLEYESAGPPRVRVERTERGVRYVIPRKEVAGWGVLRVAVGIGLAVVGALLSVGGFVKGHAWLGFAGFGLLGLGVVIAYDVRDVSAVCYRAMVIEAGPEALVVRTRGDREDEVVIPAAEVHHLAVRPFLIGAGGGPCCWLEVLTRDGTSMRVAFAGEGGGAMERELRAALGMPAEEATESPGGPWALHDDGAAG